MKAKPRVTISLAQLLAAFAVLPLVFHVFTHNQLYTLILQDLDFVFPNFHNYQTPILVVLFAGLWILVMFGNENVTSRTYVFLWILLLPSILWFSNLDWFKILGVPFNLGMLSANLPFIEVLITGLVLVTTRIFFSFVCQIKNTGRELLGRGASEPDAQRAMNKQSVFFSTLILGCMGATLLIVTATSTAKTALQAWLPPLPYPYIVLGLSSATVLIICTALYLRSNAEISKRSPISPDQASAKTPIECDYLTGDRRCGAIKKGELLVLRGEGCRGEIKDGCCYSCNLREKCSISCNFLDLQRAIEEAENVARARAELTKQDMGKWPRMFSWRS